MTNFQISILSDKHIIVASPTGNVSVFNDYESFSAWLSTQYDVATSVNKPSES